MKIIKSEFVKGVIGDDYGMKDKLPHIAFFGRSNAGKSSVINSLVAKKDFAKANKMPGKTRVANFFRINDSFYLVDFPGYGYARRSIEERNKMIKRIFWYIEFSPSRPRAVFLITDANIGLTSLDKEMLKLLKVSGHKVIIVANKIDKMSKTALEKQLLSVRKDTPDFQVFPYSAKTGEGREGLIEKIESFV
jgi:GTP-binding protein